MIRWIINGLLIAVFFTVFAILITLTEWDAAQEPDGLSPEIIGYTIFTTYGAVFEVASLLLLAAMVGAIYLVKKNKEESR